MGDQPHSSEAPGGAAAKTERAGPWRRLRRMARWKQALVVLSVALMGLGVALPFALPGADAPPQAPGGGLPAGAHGLAPTTDFPAAPDGDAEAFEESAGSELSPAIFRLGFSFFVGFAIAFAVRSFLRIALVVIGLYLLLTFGLEYAGLLEVRWGAVAEGYESFAAWLRAETESLRAFITGRVPAAAAALAGLGIGFTRK